MTCIGTREFTVYTKHYFLSLLLFFLYTSAYQFYSIYIFWQKPCLRERFIHFSNSFYVYLFIWFPFHGEKMSIKIVLSLQKNFIFDKRIGNLVISIYIYCVYTEGLIILFVTTILLQCLVYRKLQFYLYRAFYPK